MPELPEVQTIVDDLNKKVKEVTITDVWTDWPKYFKRSPGGFEGFKKAVKGEKIKMVWRLGKNIIFDLSGGKKLLIHQKMTGHLLVGKWQLNDKKWIAVEKGLLAEKVNGYIHTMFWLGGPSSKIGASKMLALSDLRKFAKILVVDNKDFKNLEDVKNIGPDPLKPSFKFREFKGLITKKRGVIKKILMDQNIISGIGNIYADEILFTVKIHPLKRVENLSDGELKLIFNASKNILKKAIKLRGTSTSDFRDTSGKAGFFGAVLKVYKREGEKCPNKCGGIIKRIKIGGRSAHFCSHCQIHA